MPEPWATRLIVDGQGQLFVDERDLWPGGDFVTAHIIVRTPFLRDHPERVRAWLEAHVDVTRWAIAHPDEAKAILNDEIERLTGARLSDEVLTMAWERLRPTWDPLSSSLVSSADAAYRAGFLKEQPDLAGIYDLALLNAVLEELGLPRVQ